MIGRFDFTFVASSAGWQAGKACLIIDYMKYGLHSIPVRVSQNAVLNKLACTRLRFLLEHGVHRHV
jgi:hypothetical protein